jgi:tetratricopeptide (TPR) repeat protein
MSMEMKKTDKVERLGRKIRYGGLSTLSIYLIYLLNLLPATLATPLDDKIAAFKDADTQTEAAVADLLKVGLSEQRSAEALVAVRPWLTDNTPRSQAALFYAGRTMHYSGNWSDAVIFYRKLLKSKSVDAKLAGVVVPATYRLMINDMRDSESAYLFMREDGSRLRAYGRAKQFDRWFLREAVRRSDVRALADRLAAIHRNASENPADYAEFMQKLYAQLETFAKRDEDTVAALDDLARVATREPGFKARWDWINAVSTYLPEAGDLTHHRKPIPEELLAEPMKAARALIAKDPLGGASLVVKGWSQWNHGDTPTFFRFAHAHRDLKAEPFVKALARLQPADAKKLLAKGAKCPRGRWVSVAGFISPKMALSVVPRFPTIFNAIDAPAVSLWDAKMTVTEAKALAPHIARNPHGEAALVRAYAVAGTNLCSKVLPAVAKSESWRFSGDHRTSAARRMVDTVWNAGLDRTGVDHAKMVKQYEAEFSKRNAQLVKQVAKEADSKSRMAAFNKLYGELRGTPSTPGALGLWHAVLTQAPYADKAQMLKKLTADYVSAEAAAARPVPAGQSNAALLVRRDLQTHLLRQALGKVDFGNPYAKISLGPHFAGGWDRWGHQHVRKDASELGAYLETVVRKQMEAGTLSESIFSMWLHCVEPKKAESVAFMKALVKSPAYLKMDKAFHKQASHSLLFGALALTEKSATDPHVVSRELLELPEAATPEQVAAALKAVMTRVSKATEPVQVIGLHKVAALPKIEGDTRKLALMLFDGLSPLGNYPSRQGYEQLARRLVKEAQEAGKWGDLVPYASSLWRCAASPDDNRSDHNNHHVQIALIAFAEAALEAESFATALSVGRCGLASGVPINQRRGRLNAVAGKAAVALGVVEIPVDETDPAYAIFKSNSDFIQGNLDSAWKLYLANDALLMPKPRDEEVETKPLLRRVSVEYGFWLLKRNIAEGRTDEAEALVKELTIWSRQEEGLLSIEQQAELKIAYADLAFRKGALPTARAWYRKVADAREYRGSDVHLRAALGSVMIDRVSRNFGAALEELDKLLNIKIPGARSRIHYARAEVLMDQEAYKEALEEVEAVLRRDSGHEDARILRGRIEILMRRLVEATEIELGLTREDEVMVPGEVLKINLLDPTLSISGVGADIEVEVWAKSGDRERVMLHQVGDNKEKFRADVPTALAVPMKGDKTLQVLGVDEIRFGYSQRFRAKMKDLPPDPKTVITIASDAHLTFSAGAFPARKGERTLDIEELGLTTAQRKLGMRTVRPGNPVYLRVIDADQSKTAGIDQLPVSLETSSGDVIRRLLLKETGPYTGEFEGIVPTTGAQAMAFASEMAPGRDPNMAISAKDYPGWLGNVGDKEKARTFGVDMNDNVPLDTMTLKWLAEDQAITHFVLQTSLNGRDWVTRARYPDAKNMAPWDGRPRVSSIPTYRGGIPVSKPKGRGLPQDWQEKMELGSARASCGYLAAYVSGLSAENLPMVNTGHPGYSGLRQYRSLFYQSEMAVRRLTLSGYPAENTIFLLDGAPADEESDDPLTIERELTPGLHEIQVWRHDGADTMAKSKPVIKIDGAAAPDSLFAPTNFPAGVQALIPQSAGITNVTGGIEVAFAANTQARLVRLSIHGFQGVAPGIKQVTLTGRDSKAYLPVEQDFMALRDNKQLEVLPGDRIMARYEDPVSATPKRTKHAGSLGVAFNTATMSASFLNYETTTAGRRLILEPIRRFNLEDAVAIVIDDVDMDGSSEKDVVEFTALTSAGQETKLKAVETEAHSGRFVGRIFPVTGKPQRASELQVPEGGTLTLTYRDMENLNPGIPTDRSVTIEHAKYMTPVMGAYTTSSELIPVAPSRRDGGPAVGDSGLQKKNSKRSGPEVFGPRRTLGYSYVDEAKLTTPLKAVIGGSVRFDVVATHLALAQSSEINAYVQVVGGRALGESGPHVAPSRREGGSPDTPFDITAPGTIKLTGKLGGGGGAIPRSYTAGQGAGPGGSGSALDQGRFAFSVPLILGDRPGRSFATQAEERSGAEAPEGLVVQAGDTVRIGYAWKDARLRSASSRQEGEKVQWKTATATVGSHAFLDVMNASYNEALDRVFVGERIFLRVLAPGLDRGPERDMTSVSLKATTGAAAVFNLRETLPHSGLFKGVFTVNYADAELPAELPPVELNGFPVRYGDDVTVSYAAMGVDPEQSVTVAINRGADGLVEPFSKRFTGDEMAVRTSFTLSECFFELAKKHRKMDQESLARREMAHAKKLLQEAIATHRDDDLRAQAEYLLGNLAQEYSDLSKNDEAKLPGYQEALARFVKIPVDYPETEYAHKAQFKTGLVYEKMGEGEIAVEEYVKLAYKYPDSEHIPEVMARLGKYFQAAGQVFKVKADALREEEDVESQAKVLRFDELSYPEFVKAAIIYGKLQERFPDHKLAGLAGLASSQNYMRAHQYETAIDGFKIVVDNEEYDDTNIRAQALFFSGWSYELMAASFLAGNYKGIGNARQEAYETYRRVTFDFPDSKWAKKARGRLSDAAFAKIIEVEEQKREKMLEAIEYEKIKRAQDKGQKKLMDRLLKR